MEYMVTVCH